MLDRAGMRSIEGWTSFGLKGREIMETTRLIRASRHADEASGARARALLSLDEVRASGLPAYFFDHGEELFYLAGELFDLRDAEAAQQAGQDARPLPPEILTSGVGIEYGWRHMADCACQRCCLPALNAAGAAVA